MCYLDAHLEVGLVATALHSRAKRLQDDPRLLVRKNVARLRRLADVYLDGQEQEGSLQLPPLSLSAQVEAIELIRYALLAECTRHRAEGKEELADSLHEAVNSLLMANPVAGSFVVAEEELEELHGPLTGADGGPLYEVPHVHRLGNMGLAAVH